MGRSSEVIANVKINYYLLIIPPLNERLSYKDFHLQGGDVRAGIFALGILIITYSNVIENRLIQLFKICNTMFYQNFLILCIFIILFYQNLQYEINDYSKVNEVIIFFFSLHD